MPIINRIAEFQDDMTAWRRHIHQHPETAFEEHQTSDYVALRLHEFGIDVHRGLAGTGVVGSLKGNKGDGPAIGLRADMDALDIEEKNDVDYKSETPGKMHACGHDGHSTMLLGAAKYLAETKNFAGTVHFIFQPAEEGLAGARAMMEDGLFERFPCDEVYGMHNWPQLGFGQMAVGSGPMMAASDLVKIEIEGVGAHAAMPHRGVDPVYVSSQVISSLQSLVSRSTNPADAAVVSITKVEAGSASNVIPRLATLTGTCRSFRPETRDMLEAGVERIATGIAAARGATATVTYSRGYPPTVNHPDQTLFAAEVAASLLGEQAVDRSPEPSMGGEDFAFMLEEVPGSYVWLGTGGEFDLHHPRYDFNDEALPMGASFWVELVEARLGDRRAG